MKHFFFLGLCAVFISNTSFGQENTILLWKDNVPNQKETNETETQTQEDILWIRNVQQPALEIFLPEKLSATGKAVVICPGGGYGGLAYGWEGTSIAKMLNAKGMAAFVLKYRLPTSKSIVVKHKAPLQDVQRAIRVVRDNASTWGIIKDQIGIMGFSAGGHLAATLGTHYKDTTYPETGAIDSISAKPNFMVLVYPVISMRNTLTHKGSKNNLLGENPKQELVDYYSNEMHVSADTPPTFIVHSGDDKVVSVMNSMKFYEALIKENINTEMHIYPEGGHGFSLAIDRGYLSSWTNRFDEWIQRLK